MPASPVKDKPRALCKTAESPPSYSLGCIFDNPVAFEDSRRKIDCGVADMVGQPTRGAGQPRVMQARAEQASSRRQLNSSLRSGRPCRRMLALDLEEARAGSSSSSLVPTLRDSKCRSASGKEFLELSFEEEGEEEEEEANAIEEEFLRSNELPGEQEEAGCCTPVSDVLTPPMCTPVRSDSSASAGSLEITAREDNGTTDEVPFAVESNSSSRSASWPADYSVYPGWSLWTLSSRQHSYRSIHRDSPLPNSSCAPALRRLPCVKSLHHTLLLASRQKQVGVSRPATATSPALSSVGPNKVVDYRNRTTPVEEGKLTVLKAMRKQTRRKNWEPVTSFARGFKSLTSKGLPQSGYNFPSVIPLPGCNTPSIAEDDVLMPEKLQRPSNAGTQDSLESMPLSDGYLQCIFKNGVASYSFWKDNFEEIFVAKAADLANGDKCFTFYSCKRQDRGGWKQLQKSMVNRAGTMRLSSSIFTEVDCRGEAIHYMNSEFSLLDERTARKKQQPKKSTSVSSYLKSLWSSSLMNDMGPTEIGYRSEIAAMVVRVPLRVKKDRTSIHPAAKRSATRKPLDKFLRSKHLEQMAPTQLAPPKTSWSSVVGGASETITVILPRGDHGHPTCGLEGPRPLIDRWRSGGLCDCGSWDLGCGIIILSRDYEVAKQGDDQPLELLVEGRKQRILALSLTQCQDGLFKLRYQEPLASLQAFAAAVAILHSKLDLPDYRDNWSQEWQTKLPVAKESLRKSTRCHPNPPLSPNDRL